LHLRCPQRCTSGLGPPAPAAQRGWSLAMALVVKSMEPSPSWGDLVPLDLLHRSANRPSSAVWMGNNIWSRTWNSEGTGLPSSSAVDLYGPDSCERPTSMAPPSSGDLGPGAYTCNEGQTRPNPICRSWGKSERFKKLVKEPELPDDPASRKETSSPRRPEDQDKRPACQSAKPIRNPRIKLGRSNTTTSLPTIRDAYKFTSNARVMVGAKPMHEGEGRRLISTANVEYEVPGRSGKSEGKLFLRSEFPRPGAGISSIMGVQTEATYRLFVGGGTKRKPV